MNRVKSILVVDDELLIRDLLYDFFSNQGWSVAVADSGDKALEITRTKSFDVVLTDIRMGDMDGLTLAARVRELNPKLPVLLMTGYPSVDSAVAALRLRVDDYIVKPFNINQLYRAVEQSARSNAAEESAAGVCR